MSVLGNRVVRKEDPGLLTGATPFVADIRRSAARGRAARHVRALGDGARSHHFVDTSAAVAAAGVVGVFTAADLGLSPQPSPFSPPFMTCPLAIGVVRYVGEPIAVVVTESRRAG